MTDSWLPQSRPCCSSVATSSDPRPSLLGRGRCVCADPCIRPGSRGSVVRLRQASRMGLTRRRGLVPPRGAASSPRQLASRSSSSRVARPSREAGEDGARPVRRAPFVDRVGECLPVDAGASGVIPCHGRVLHCRGPVEALSCSTGRGRSPRSRRVRPYPVGADGSIPIAEWIPILAYGSIAVGTVWGLEDHRDDGPADHDAARQLRAWRRTSARPPRSSARRGSVSQSRPRTRPRHRSPGPASHRDGAPTSRSSGRW